MELTAIIPLIVCIIGLIVYIVSSNPKISEVGRIAFFCGLLATCLAFAGSSVHVGSTGSGIDRR